MGFAMAITGTVCKADPKPARATSASALIGKCGLTFFKPRDAEKIFLKCPG
jgi:hypothetical protein